MMVQNTAPITFSSQPTFLSLNNEMARKLGISLERDSIRRLVIEEVKNKNYFAINVRFVDENNKILTQTLGMKDSQAYHTSNYLQKLV